MVASLFILLAAVVFVAVGLFLLAQGSLKLLGWLRLRRTEVSAAVELDPGLVEVEGRAAALEETLPAAVTDDTRTLAYEYRVERHVTDQDGDSDWRLVDYGSSAVPFVVDVDGMEVVVNPERAEFQFGDEVETVIEPGENLTGSLAAFAEDNDDVMTDETVDVGPLTLDGTSHRIKVERLDPGEQVYVAGHLRHPRDASLEAEVGDRRYVLEKRDDSPSDLLRLSPLLIADAGESVAQKRLREEGLLRFGGGIVFLGFVGVTALAIVVYAGQA